MKRLTLLFLILSFGGYAQWSDQEYLLEYKKAIQLYASGDVSESLEKLVPLTGRNYSNPVVPYAMYYYALISHESGRGSEARSMLRDLFQRFPDWDKMDEAYYLYGISNLSDKYYEEGLSYLDRITDPGFETNKEDAIYKFISGLENIVLLKDLNRKFPLNKTIAETLVKRIQSRSYNTRADLELSDELTNRFKIKSGDKNKDGKRNGDDFKRSFDDGVIDFGVLLPFGLDKFNIREAASDERYVYDLYYGMEKAAAKLNQEGINVRLLGYDVGSSGESMSKYLKNPDFRQLDVVVGPLYGAPNRLLEAYAEKNKIYQIHPISNNSSLIVGSDSRFLVQPSNKTQAAAALDFVLSQNLEKSVSIYFGESKKDSILAAVYAEEALEKGFKVLEVKHFRGVNSISKSHKPGHVFIATESGTGPVLIRALGQQGADGFIMAAASSFNLETVSRGTLNKNLYLIAPEFIDYLSDEIKTFRKSYIEEMHILPSYYAYLGYDMLLYYGRMLKDGKEIFRLNLNESPGMDDLLLSGFDYSGNSAENLVVPIIKYNDGLFEVVN